MDAIYEKRIEDIPKRVLDPFFMKEQSLWTQDRTFALGDPTQALPYISVDDIRFEIREGLLHMVGFKRGHVVARQIMQAFNATAVAADNEKVVVTTKKGDMLVLDKAFLLEYAFQHPMPFFTAYQAGKNTRTFVGHKALEITFMTRGLRPFVEGEVERILNTNYEKLADAPIIPMNKAGEAVFEAGDIVVFDRDGDSRKLVAIMNRKVVSSVMARGHKLTAMAGTLFSFEGMRNTLSEAIASRLKVDNPGDIRSPIVELLEALETEADGKKHTDEIAKKISQDELLKKYFRSFDQKKLRLHLGRAKEFDSHQSEARDHYTLSEWWASYEKINATTDDIVTELKGRQEVSDFQDKERIQEDIDRLQQQKDSQDFRHDYQEIVRTYISGETNFHRPEKKLLEMIREKSVQSFRFLAWGLGAGMAAWTGVSVFEHYAPTIAHEFFFTASHWWQMNQPELLSAEYRWVTLLGMTYLTMVIPLTVLYGYSMVPIMKHLQNWIRPLTNGSGATAKYARDIDATLHKYIYKYEDLSIWRRIVTVSTFPYAILVRPFINTILDSILKQPTVEVWRAGLNPFTKISYDSATGKKIGLKEGENIRLGFSKLTKIFHHEKQETEKALKEHALKVKISEATNAKSIAWNLAALVVAKEKGVDPASLFALATGNMSVEEIQSIYQNKRSQSLWRDIAAAVYYDIQRQIKTNPNFDIQKVSPEQVAEYYSLAETEADKLKSATKGTRLLIQLRNQFRQMGSNGSKVLGNFGLSEYNFLVQNTANEYVSQQTKREYVQDTAMVIGLPPFLGPRSKVAENLAIGRPDQIAHHPDYLFYTPPPHLTDMGTNTLIHLIVAGPRRMLVMQILEAMKENNYRPIDAVQTRAADRKEGLIKGAVNWSLNLLDARKSNLGGYYTKGMVRRINTVQASISLFMIMRMTLGEQSAQAAWMASWFFWMASELTYGWPWMIIDVGNSQEERRTGVKRESHESIVREMLEGFRNHDNEQVDRSFQRLTQLYKKYGRVARKPMNEALKEYNKSLDLAWHTQVSPRELRNALKGPNAESVFAIMGKLYKAQMHETNADLKHVYIQLEEAVRNNKPLSKTQLRAYARDFADFSLSAPPLQNTPNSYLASITTFGLGAVLTTVLAAKLGYMSFDPSNHNIETIIKWAGYNAVFYASLMLLFSKHSWEKYYVPGINKMKSKMKRGKACYGLFGG